MNIGMGHNGGPALNIIAPRQVLTLRYYQREAIDSIYNYFATMKGNPIVAMPTGTGKSVVIGGFAYEVLQRWPGQRLLMATHVKELISQNASKLQDIWPGAPYGIYSAGLKQRDVDHPIIYGGVASMVVNPALFGWRDLLLVDECHLIGKNDAAMYNLFIAGLRNINPKLKVVGFTATGYRQGMGYLTNGDLFTDFCYDITGMEAFNRLIVEGYLAMLISPRTEIGIDSRGVHTSSTGDYVQHEAEAAAMRVTWEALNDAAKYKHNRHSWLVFAGGIEHAEATVQMLRALGISACAVHGGNKQHPMTSKQRDQNLADFKAGKYQACVNYNVLTTGFDHPPVDLIVVLRLTKSVVLWVQMLGRGTRPFHGNEIFPPKSNCLVLDYARNIEKLGPVNDPVIPRPKGQGAGEAPIKVCEECGGYNHISARFCVQCGNEFEFAVKIKKDADVINEPIRDMEPIYERFKVTRVMYRRHHSTHSGLDSLAAVYTVEGRLLPFTEYIPIESAGRARARAENWWSSRVATDCPLTINEALQQQSMLRTPTVLTVWTNIKYPEIVRVDYD